MQKKYKIRKLQPLIFVKTNTNLARTYILYFKTFDLSTYICSTIASNGQGGIVAHLNKNLLLYAIFLIYEDFCIF